MKTARTDIAVGIIANPASGRDIRRLVAQASGVHLSEKCNRIARVLTALRSVGVARALMMPDVGGIAARVRRTIRSRRPSESAWPELIFLDMPIEDGPVDTVRAVEKMVAADVRTIVVLGGDGTHRWVASACGDTPLLALSTGTNNVFPEIREPTVAGLAAGLVATGQIARQDALLQNKVLRVEVQNEVHGAVEGGREELAVVDVTISNDLWIGSRAIWRPDSLSQIFVTFAESNAIGLSSVAGLLHPLDRHAPCGLRVDLAPPHLASTIVNAPIAPGLIAPIGIAAVEEILPGEAWTVAVPRGVIALDGEREIEFSPSDKINIRLDMSGPFTIDIDRVMSRAATGGLLLERQLECTRSARREGFTHADQ